MLGGQSEAVLVNSVYFKGDPSLADYRLQRSLHYKNFYSSGLEFRQVLSRGGCNIYEVEQGGNNGEDDVNRGLCGPGQAGR